MFTGFKVCLCQIVKKKSTRDDDNASYISYFYGMIQPICAESAVKHQTPTNELCSYREGLVQLLLIIAASYLLRSPLPCC